MLRLATCKDLIDLLGHYNKTKYINDNDFAWGLKQLGTLFCIQQIEKTKPRNVLEAGAGLNLFFDTHFGQLFEYWISDSSGFYPEEAFKEAMSLRRNTRYVDGLLGDFSSELPENYFDLVFSISVLEHTPFNKLSSVFKDIHRVLRPGGKSVHTIDVNPYSPAANFSELLMMIEGAGFAFDQEPLKFLWDIHSAQEPVLLEPLRIVYEYYYRKNINEYPVSPYPGRYYFGSIMVSVIKK
ncbi:class I SAM-dependent methyltransferase [Trichlorobacter ammonificans]|uniref:Methyltransferase type 11 domain-containing protein n=1 Tax=Trichlorobacter ammonificans TaxID=2916410 RepID=A0ABM9D695_9BACT|nr:class I SAM-dependent methyltransferase [Trichlorobacter ammonificans]CAH2029931.1 protein of unknown function [Trichlorobacter ammonificans]